MGTPHEHHPLGSGDTLVLPHAIAAGLGELGKHGSVLHSGYGSLLRLALVTTDLELAVDGPRDLALADVCTRCKGCERACPPGAISSETKDVRGSIRALRWGTEWGLKHRVPAGHPAGSVMLHSDGGLSGD